MGVDKLQVLTLLCDNYSENVEAFFFYFPMQWTKGTWTRKKKENENKHKTREQQLYSTFY